MLARMVLLIGPAADPEFRLAPAWLGTKRSEVCIPDIGLKIDDFYHRHLQSVANRSPSVLERLELPYLEKASVMK
jgi:hypothetical protein